MKKKKKLIILISVVLLVTICIGFGISYAKYASTSVWNYYLKSKGFYFSSDKLNSKGLENVDVNWDGGPVYFDIKNSLNEELITDYDIKYKVKCNLMESDIDDAVCYLNGTESSEYEGVLSGVKACVDYENESDVSSLDKTSCEMNGYTWKDVEAVKDVYFEIKSASGTVTNAKVQIKVESTNPYKQVLEGTFVLNKNSNQEKVEDLQYESKDNYDTIIVTNSTSQDKCVKIKWSSDKYRVDNDIDNLLSTTSDENGYIDSITFKISAKNSDRVIFYRVDKSVHGSTSDFEVTYEDCQ